MTPRCQAVILKLKERADKHMEDHTAQVRRERERESNPRLSGPHGVVLVPLVQFLEASG